MIIDTHAHLMFPDFAKDLQDVLLRAKIAHVGKIINVGCDLKSCGQSLFMAGKYPQLYATLGMHPYEADLVTEKLMMEWEKLILANKKVVAIGECGLDYFKGKVDKEIQKQAFRLQLALAQKMNLPVIVHNRDADKDSLEILKEFKVKAVFHCYGSNVQFAQELWDLGYLTSFTGIVTYPSAKEIQEVAKNVLLDLFMVETDCPYLAPQAYRGKRNESSYVVEVVKEIAKLKNISFQEIEKISTENAQRFFAIAD